MKKSYCAKCKIEIKVDIPEALKLSDGRIVNGFKSKDHGCGEEFVQFQCPTTELGWSREDVEEMFNQVGGYEQ